jgi:hypothetical protein
VISCYLGRAIMHELQKLLLTMETWRKFAHCRSVRHEPHTEGWTRVSEVRYRRLTAHRICIWSYYPVRSAASCSEAVYVMT